MGCYHVLLAYSHAAWELQRECDAIVISSADGIGRLIFHHRRGRGKKTGPGRRLLGPQASQRAQYPLIKEYIP